MRRCLFRLVRFDTDYIVDPAAIVSAVDEQEARKLMHYRTGDHRWLEPSLVSCALFDTSPNCSVVLMYRYGEE